MSNFSLQRQCIVKLTGGENEKNHQQGDIVLMYTNRFFQVCFLNVCALAHYPPLTPV